MVLVSGIRSPKNTEFPNTYGNPLAALPQGVSPLSLVQVGSFFAWTFAACVNAAEGCIGKN